MKLRHKLGYGACAVALAAAVGWGYWSHMRAERAAAERRAAERAAFAEAEIATMRAVSRRELRARLDAATRESAELAEQIAAVRRTAPAAEPEVLIDWSTGPIEIACP